MRHVRIFAFAGILAACSGDPPVRDAGGIAAATDSLDFGLAFVGGSARARVRVQNRAPGARRVAAVASGPFVVVGGAGRELSSGEVTEIEVEFRPTAEGPASGELVVSEESTRVRVRLTGEGTSRTFEVDVLVDLGDAPVGATVTRSVSVTTHSRLPVLVGVAIADDAEESFGIDAGALSIPAGGSSSFDVSFHPRRSGDHLAALLLRACSSCPATTVHLQGRGVEPRFRIAPDSIELGFVPVGETREASIELRNTGQVPVEIQAVSLRDGPGSPFALEAPGAPFALEQAATLLVRFSPVWAGREAALVRIATGEGVFEVPVSGSGGTAPLAIEPAVVEFGLQPLLREVVRTVQVQGADALPVTIDQARVEGRDSSSFDVRSAPELPVELAGSSLQLDVVLFAREQVELEASLVLVTSLGEHALPIHGRGVAGGLCSLDFPAVLELGLVGVGDLVERTLSLRNTGTMGCTVADLRLEGDPGFRLATQPPAEHEIAAGSSFDLGVLYEPDAPSLSLRHAQLSFRATSDGEQQRSIDVSALASQAALHVSPRPVSFGDVAQGGRLTLAVDLTNEGRVPVSVEGAAAWPATFASTAAPGYIPSGATRTIGVTFRTGSTGLATGLLQLDVAGAPAPILVPLEGRTVAEPCGGLCLDLQARCPADRSGWVESAIELDGVVFDPGGATATCSWSLVGNPPDSAAWVATDGCTAVLQADLGGTYELELAGSVASGRTATCRTRLDMRPFPGLSIRSSWIGDADVDLHAFDEDAGALQDPASWRAPEDDVWQGRPWLETGAQGVLVHQRGPATSETVRVEGPSGVYRVGLHRSGEELDGATVDVTTEITCGGVRVAIVDAGLDRPRRARELGTVTADGSGACDFVPSGIETELLP